MTEQGYATQVERLFNDPRSDRTWRILRRFLNRHPTTSMNRMRWAVAIAGRLPSRT